MEDVEPERGKPVGLGVGSDEAGAEGAGGAVSAGEGAVDAARATGAVRSTELVPSASAVHHIDLNELLPECSDDV